MPPVDPADWVDRYGDYLFRFAMLRVRDPSLAEDLVQETFLAALKDRGAFSGGSSEATWLVAILKHKIYDHLRRRSREAPLPDGDLSDGPEDPFDPRGHWRRAGGPADWGENPEELLRRKEFLDRLSECLEALPRNLAVPFVLREVDGADTKEICKVLGITETNLWVLLHRARARLRKCLEARWFKGSPEEKSV